MGNTTKLAAAVALLVLTGCATQPPQGAVTCETQERKFRDLHKAGELKAASQAFSNLIKDCPATLTGTLRSRVLPFMRDLLTDSALDDTSYRIHGSLFTSGWTAETDTETDYFWLQLVQRHLQHGSVRAARQVSQKIVEPASLLQMRVDRRFDALVSADPSHFDIAAAIERNLARRRAEAAAAPRALEPWMRLTAALAGAGRYQETLDAANDAIARGPQAFDEYSKLYPWLLTAKGWALLDLRRVDEAIAALDAAEKYAVGTHAYVNFAINLGVAQERVARADAALATFAKVVGTSEHGGLILQVGIANAALQTGDLPRANEAMLRAREARWTGVRLYTRALLRAGRVDEARELMLELLRNPNWRGQMLADVQNYRTLPPLPAERDEFARFKALVNLPEVHQAILEVGHIENFDFPHP